MMDHNHCWYCGKTLSLSESEYSIFGYSLCSFCVREETLVVFSALTLIIGLIIGVRIGRMGL